MACQPTPYSIVFTSLRVKQPAYELLTRRRTTSRSSMRPIAHRATYSQQHHHHSCDVKAFVSANFSTGPRPPGRQGKLKQVTMSTNLRRRLPFRPAPRAKHATVRHCNRPRAGFGLVAVMVLWKGWWAADSSIEDGNGKGLGD